MVSNIMCNDCYIDRYTPDEMLIDCWLMEVRELWN